GARLAVSRLAGDDVAAPPWAVVGLGRQDALLAGADVAICGGGHGARLAVSRLAGDDVAAPPWAVVGLGRQDALLAGADVAICGGGHGMVAKALLAGVPLVVVPGGGDQWEIANRVVRQGSAELVRPLTAESLTAAVGAVLAAPRYRAAARRAAADADRVADPVQVCHEALARSG
ncbi:glycosyltransferase, partial [Mycolicibacillus trivialis]|uniref:glycosyltransferase n=1 Tax=Mycolicibacillus trivialis TaxID=1798 RepID=UPI0023DF06E8